MEYSKDHLSQWVDFFAYNPASRHRRRILKNLLAPLKFRSVLDVGCGDGRFLGFLRAIFSCEVYGLESDDSLVRTRVPLNGYYAMSIAQKTPDRSFDVVVAAEVLEHIPDDAATLKNIRKICRRYLLVTVPSLPIRNTDKYMGHVRHYTMDGLRSLVEWSGFRVLDCFAWGFPFHSFYKAMQDVAPGYIIKGFGSGSYDWKQKAVSNALYALFFLNVKRCGRQIFLLGEVQ